MPQSPYYCLVDSTDTRCARSLFLRLRLGSSTIIRQSGADNTVPFEAFLIAFRGRAVILGFCPSRLARRMIIPIVLSIGKPPSRIHLMR